MTTGITAWQPLELTKDRLDLMRRQVCPPSASEQEFLFFVEWCRQTGLNPFLRQAYLVERWDAVTGAKRHEPLVAEAGFAALADTQPDYGGIRSGVVYAGDEFFVDEAANSVLHRWTTESRAAKGGRLLGAWAHGRRTGREVEITYLTLESRQQKRKDGQPTRFWATDAAGMLRKCARADQFRRLYPALFSGWYEPAEMSGVEDDGPNSPSVVAKPSSDAATRALAAKLGTHAVDPARSSAPSRVVDTAAALTPPVPPPPQPPVSPASPPEPTMAFGPRKGTPLADCTTVELLEAQEMGAKRLAEAGPKDDWVDKLRVALAEVDAEVQRRESGQ